MKHNIEFDEGGDVGQESVQKINEIAEPEMLSITAPAESDSEVPLESDQPDLELSIAQPNDTPSEAEVDDSTEPKTFRVEVVTAGNKHASESSVVSAVRRGENQTLIITREEVGGPVVHEATEGLVPPGPAPKESEASSSEGTIKSWVRVEEDFSLQLADTTDETPKGITQLLDKHPEPFSIVVRGVAVSDTEASQISDNVADWQQEAAETKGQDEEARRLTALRIELIDGKSTALVRREIAVGSVDPETARKVGAIVAGSVLESADKNFYVDTGAGTHGSVNEALGQPRDEIAGYVKAGRLAEEMSFPQSDIPGIKVQVAYEFGANREVPPDARFNVATIIDNQGNPAGPLSFNEKDIKGHGILLAATGSGKTNLINTMTIEAVSASRDKFEETGKGYAVVIVDGQKSDNFGQDLADMLAGAELPSDYATVRVIDPKESGTFANINLLRSSDGIPPAEQGAVVIGTLGARFSKGDAQAERVFTKYGLAGVDKAREILGWNPVTNESRYPHTPPDPDLHHVKIGVEESLDSQDFDEETKNNIGAFTKEEIQNGLRGLPGQLFSGGHDIDWQKVCSTPGVTVISLGAITDEDYKNLAITGVFNGIAGEQKARHPKDTDELDVFLQLDEAGRAFAADTQTGALNAKRFTLVRGAGMGVWFAKQNGLEDIHRDARDNIEHTFAGRVKGASDKEVLAGRMGVTPDSLNYLSTMPDAPDPAGRGLYHGKEGKPVRFKVADLREASRGEGELKGAEDLVDLGPYRRAYSNATKQAALEFITDNAVGERMRAQVELNAFLVASGRDPERINDDGLKDELSKIDPTLLECAVTTACKEAAASRSDILNVAGWKDFTRYNDDYIIADITNGPLPASRPDLSLDYGTVSSPNNDSDPLQELESGYYGRVEDKIINAMQAAPIADKARYEAAIGRKIGGQNGQDQLDNAVKLEKASIDTIARAIESSGGPESLKPELAKLMGGTQNVDPEIRGIRSKIEARLSRRLTPEEVVSFSHAFQSVTQELPAVGFPALRQALSQSIEAARNAKAVDLSDMEQLYGEGFPGGNAREQLAVVKARQRARTNNASYKVAGADLLFARDLIKGGFTLDNIVESLVAKDSPQGQIFKAQQQSFGKGAVKTSLIERLKGDSSVSKPWRDKISRLLFKELKISPASRQLIQAQLDTVITELNRATKEMVSHKPEQDK